MLVLPDPIAPYIYNGAVRCMVINCTLALACLTWSLRYKKRGLGESLNGSSSRRKYSSTSIYLSVLAYLREVVKWYVGVAAIWAFWERREKWYLIFPDFCGGICPAV